MLRRKTHPVSLFTRWLALPACIVAAILSPAVRAEQPANMDAQRVQASPKKIVWSSQGSANVLDDNSIEFRGSNGWQEVTLYFQPSQLEQIKRVLLEVLPSARFRANSDQRVVLFDVKPHVQNAENKTTELEFRSCRFLGNEADETAANCIDFLSDTGWTVPDFVGNDACHQLVLELRKPVTLQRDDMFAITIDSGGAPDLKPLSRIRVSFSGTDVGTNQDTKNEISAGAQDRTIIKGVPFDFRWYPPGEFLMGSPPGTESKYGDRFVQQHKVKLTRGYWMSATEVTQAQYAAVMGSNPSFWQRRTKMQNPVEQVTWEDAASFCKKLTELDPDYEYRLPTEAEWEYACRAGETECRYGDILEIAWVFMNTDEGEGSSGHRPVGTKTPNKWGLHDMFGNVAEWCADWHAPPARENQTDPHGPEQGESRVVRGDDCFVCWTFLRSDGACMAGTRSGFPPSTSSRVIGFRIVRVPRSDGITEPYGSGTGGEPCALSDDDPARQLLLNDHSDEVFSTSGLTSTSKTVVALDENESPQSELHGGKSLDQWIAQARDARDLEDRHNAMQVVRNFGLRTDRAKALRVFTELLSDEVATIRSLSAAGLRKAGRPTDPDALKKLIEILSEDLSHVRFPQAAGEADAEFGLVMRAVSALSVLGDDSHLPMLQRIADNDGNDPFLRQAAKYAIRELEARGKPEPPAKVKARAIGKLRRFVGVWKSVAPDNAPPSPETRTITMQPDGQSLTVTSESVLGKGQPIHITYDPESQEYVLTQTASDGERRVFRAKLMDGNRLEIPVPTGLLAGTTFTVTIDNDTWTDAFEWPQRIDSKPYHRRFLRQKTE